MRFTTLVPILIGLLTGVAAEWESFGNVKDITSAGKNTFEITSTGKARAKVIFYEDRVFRVVATHDGKYEDIGDTDFVVQKKFKEPQVKLEKKKDAFEIKSRDVTLRVKKNPMLLTLLDKKGAVIFEEKEPLSVDWKAEKTKQTLGIGKDDQYFGGGMQMDRWNHRGKRIRVEVNYDWDFGQPNSQPFYMSNAGYGVLRHTFAPGIYDFTDSPLTATHNETRFDAYYFNGNLKEILDQYTELVGKPFLPPIYGLELGDSDCYLNNANRGKRNTLKDSTAVADGFVKNDIPLGWMLVNDGYGCGYENLVETHNALQNRHMELGLWTESDLTNQPFEVGKAGVRVRKLDVKWVGSGYQFAYNACNIAYDGIEKYSNARGFVWIVEGWAGTQKCAVAWTGDQSGNMGNTARHVATFHGSGLSGMPWVAGDVDGIFGGTNISSVRDLQLKAFSPLLMNMNGWAKFDKQQWRRGEPWTSINRKYLKLRMRLMPYIYSYAFEAHTKGLPLTRSLVLEYPKDKNTWTEAAKHEYLFGEYFLVAPVIDDGEQRDNIYLPEGEWIDYWTSKVYQGSKVIYTYPAPYDTLPLFVKAGAIIPMWPQVNTASERKPDDDLVLDVYPKGKSSFTLYEDDMVTREHRDGHYSLQTFESQVTGNKIVVRIGKSNGSYSLKPQSRGYEVRVHVGSNPRKVTWSSGKAQRQTQLTFTKDTGSKHSAQWWVESAHTHEEGKSERPQTKQKHSKKSKHEVNKRAFKKASGYDKVVVVRVPDASLNKEHTVTVEL
ncbi:uncharacterized protein VTP21DRAFT_11331 [Calcarisporiella thermophila]|uniref:uncharacterized protein n=1 Tax=Calcarisporiella thermophila TaxID=911321 RepID=UPI0037429270